MVGLPIHQVRSLQSVQNASARLICRLRRFDHVTDALVSLHWLRVPERVVYKIAVLTFKVLHGITPEHLGPVLLFVSPTCLVDSFFALLALTAWWCLRLKCQQLALELSRWPVLASGIVYQHITSAPSLSTFRQRLKSYLFRHLTF